MNTLTDFKYIMRQRYIKDGILIVTLPLTGSGAAVVDEDNKYIFINSKLPNAKRSQLINEGLRKHREAFNMANR